MTTRPDKATLPVASAGPRWLIHLLMLAVFLEFVTLPKIPGTGLAPINFVLMVGLGYLFLNTNRLQEMPREARAIMAILLIFNIWDYVLGYFLDKPDHEFPATAIRTAIELTLFSVLVRTPEELRRLAMAAGLGILVSATMGLLIYFIGEPYQSIRDWMLQSTGVSKGVSGQRLWLSGLSGEHFMFGYLVGGAPVLALTLARAYASRFWALSVGLFLVALYYNAERAPLVMAIPALLYLIVRWNLHRGFLVPMLVILIMTGYLWKEFGATRSSMNNLHSQTLFDRIKGGEDTTDRFHWLASGIKSVLNHPLTGASRLDYGSEFLGIRMKILDPKLFIPYAHNHYVNLGMNIGIPGWILGYMFLINIFRALRRFKAGVRGDPLLEILQPGLTASLLAVLGVALFHNQGVFFEEPLSIILTGLALAGCRVAQEREHNQA
ncbi:MAG: O-antigen ligase family protein [Magnetococcus sp. DMHC-1]|nr:O-antigen ligase family protein [Magnetococcales bacterium]